MRIVADGHVHFYPCYDASTAIRRLAANLGRLSRCGVGGGAEGSAPAAGVRVALLTEAKGRDFFGQLQTGTVLKGTGFRVAGVYEDLAVRVQNDAGDDLYFVAGKQFVSRERIEVLGLAVREPGMEGAPADEVIRGITAIGGVPVLSWAPGKWFFGRGKIVRRIIDTALPGALLLGDTSLRPLCWTAPLLMRWARRRGFGVIAGSDPLPFAGEEVFMGTYGFRYEGPFDPAMPVSSLRRILLASPSALSIVGRRGTPWVTLLRLVKNRRARRNSICGRNDEPT